MMQETPSRVVGERFATDLWTALSKDYQVERILGAGGIGQVKLLRDRFTERRYAVKAIHVSGAKARQRFLEELLVWTDLPAHPHLAACRFIRTFGEEIAVFAEWASGGSVADRLRSGSLTDAEIQLDVAIQASKALGALHDMGLVHQDIKPSNLLLTEDWVVKVADFGLARAAQESMLQGMTQAYRSPEQAARRPLDFRTDIWSLGVTLLEMITGEVTWLDGQFAMEVLDELLADASLPRSTLLSALVGVLRRCFHEDPTQRWPTPAEIEASLRAVYRQITGKDYARAVVLPPAIRGWVADFNDFRRSGEYAWAFPGNLLSGAYEAAGLDESLVNKLPTPPIGSLRARAVADFIAFSEARLIFARLVEDGRNDLEANLALALFNEGVTLAVCGDATGALSLFDRAAESALRYAEGFDKNVWTRYAAYFLTNKAHCLFDLADFNSANEVLDRVFSMFSQTGPALDNQALSNAHLVKSIVVRETGNSEGAIAHGRKAVELLEAVLANPRSRNEVHFLTLLNIQHQLLRNAYNLATTYRLVGDLDSAVTHFDKAIQSSGQLIEAITKLDEFAPGLSTASDREMFVQDLSMTPLTQDMVRISLAHCLAGKAYALGNKGELTEANRTYEQAVKLFREFIATGRTDLEEKLAGTLINQANLLREYGRNQESLSLHEEASLRFRRLINNRGRNDLVGVLAKIYGNKGTLLFVEGRREEALTFMDMAVHMLEEFALRVGAEAVAHDLARSWANRAGVFFRLAILALCDAGLFEKSTIRGFKGFPEGEPCSGPAAGGRDLLLRALADYDRALATYKPRLDEQSRDVVIADYAKDRLARAEVLWLLGDRVMAAAEGRAAFPELAAEVKRTGRADLQAAVQQAIRFFPEFLGDASPTTQGPSGSVVGSLASVDPEDLTEVLGRKSQVTRAGIELTAADYCNRGIAKQTLGKYEEALAEFETALRLNPDDADLYWIRGSCYRDQGRLDEALTDYGFALQITPDYAQVYNDRGNTYSALGRYEEALADYNHALSLDPKLVQAYSNRGATYNELGRYEEALADFTRALQIAPHNALAYNNRGNSYCSLNRHEEALADLNEALRLSPNLVAAFANRGKVYRALKQYPKALADYDSALKLGPQSAELYLNRGGIYHTLGRYMEALTDYASALSRNPKLAAAFANRGLTRASLGQHEEALKDYSRAMAILPGDPHDYFNRGNSYYAIGHYEEALEDYDHAILIDPNDAKAYNNRGRSYLALGSDAEALADFREALRLDPNCAEAYTNCGVVYYNYGNCSEALQAFEMANRLGDATGGLNAASLRRALGLQ
jgi:tetratricopeptide (TPR) repeat protein